MKILVIDDSRFQRNQACRMLKEKQHEVEAAESVSKALEMLDESSPDLILCDLLMPDQDGFDFLAAVSARGIKAPVFIISANIQKKVQERCLSEGAKGFINKPITDALIDEVVRRAEQETEVAS